MKSPIACSLLLAAVLLSIPASAETPPDPVAATLAKPAATGLAVLSVVEGTQSETLGVRPGDIMTHYGGKAVTSLAELNGLKGEMGSQSSIPVVIVRAGERLTLEFVPGQLGVHLIPVTEGVPTPTMPPATDVELDFSSLREHPRDEWYRFSLDGKTQCGFEHHLLWLEGDELHLRREVGFHHEQWGTNHFDTTAVARGSGFPETLRTSFTDVIGKMTFTGELVLGKDGTRSWVQKRQGPEESAESMEPAPSRLVADYMIESLAAFMPREKDACIHFEILGMQGGPLKRRGALHVVGPETFEHDGKTVEVWRVRRVGQWGQPEGSFLVDGRGRVVFADYGGAQGTLTTKAKAIDGLKDTIVPRSAR